VGARFSTAFAVTPRPLVGGGVYVERAFASRFGGSLALSVAVEGTGAFDAGPGRVWFLRGVARVEGCAFSWRPTRALWIVPCLAVEGGALHAEGIRGGSLVTADQVTVPWAGAGLLPRISVDLGRAVLHLSGGPIFPLVQRTFQFVMPQQTIHTVPPVTGAALAGAAVRFP
jgi:hypothetical protein